MNPVLCFDEDLNIITYCLDEGDFQIPFDSPENKNRIISVMSDLKQLLSGINIDHHNKKFIETATIIMLRDLKF